MFSSLIESAKRRWYAKPETVDALKRRDRAALVSSLAEPDHEAEFGKLADEMLTIEAQRDQHRARARELPQIIAAVRAKQQEIDAATRVENARQAAFAAEQAKLIEQRNALAARQSKCEHSARLLVQNIDPATQQQLDALSAERTALQENIAAMRSYHRDVAAGVRAIERNVESCERESQRIGSAASKAELTHHQSMLSNAQRRAAEAAEALAAKEAEAGMITAEIDSILADVKAGKR